MKKLMMIAVVGVAAVRPALANPKTFCGGTVSVSVGWAHAPLPAKARSTGYQATVKNNSGGPLQMKFMFSPGRFANQFSSTYGGGSFHMSYNATNLIGLGTLKVATPRSGEAPSLDEIADAVNVTCSAATR